MENNKFRKLRQQAEDLLNDKKLLENSEEFRDNAAKLLEELSISQIELELQNQQLQATQLDLEGEKTRFSDLYHNAPIGYLQLDKKGRVLDFNKKAQEILQVPDNLITNKPLIAFIQKDDASIFYTHLRKVFDPDADIEIEDGIRFINIDSNIRHLRFRSNLLKDKKSKEKYCRTIIEDITQIIDYQQKIEGLNTRLESSMIAGDLAWWEMKLPSGAVRFNRNKTDMLGDDAANYTLYKHFTEKVHPEDYEQMMEAMWKHLRGELPTYNCEYRIRHVDGHYIWFHDVGRITAKDGENIMLNGIVTRVDERKKAEKQLIELNATKDKFFSIIAHDLKNPFNSIMGFSELLVKNAPKYKAEKIQHFANLMLDATQNTYKLLENLLEWSRSQSGRISYLPTTYNLSKLMLHISGIFENQTSAKEIELHINIADTIDVFVDKDMISTVLRNFISNAVKYTPRKGTIQVFGESSADKVKISIRDSGVGMNEDTVSKLFKIDEKITSPGTENERGTGLGLILCKEFIEKHNGTIEVKSKEGEGSTFSFTVPLNK